MPLYVAERPATTRRFARAARCLASAAAVVSLTAAAPATAGAQTQPFSDTAQDAYYSEAVEALADGGVFDGTQCAPGMLCPGDPIDRKTMAVWTVRTLDGQDPGTVSSTRFSDVAADSFHAPFIERMAELGVTTGCGDGTAFCPDNPVTRKQMAVFLTRAFDLDPGPDPGFSDVAPDAWYYHQVAALAASRITVGCADGTTFCPHRQTTRAQMATFLARAAGLIDLPEPQRDAALPFEADEPSRVHNVMVRVVVVDPDWHSFEVLGGWPSAVEIRESYSLKYFEVAIWEDVSAIHFYEFDNDFDANDSSGAAAVTAERESYAIQRNAGLPAPWSAERSTFIRQAFASFTSDLVSRYPESAHHLVYSGHGGPGGALFAGQLSYEDASGMLSHWTNELGFRLGVIDMGGPCTKGAFDDVENFCQYSHYYVASDLPNGGYTLDDWTLEKYQETNPDVQYHRLFADSSNSRDALMGRIDILQKNYDYSRNNMISSKTEQANYLYSCKEFSDFGPAFRAFLTSTDSDYDIFDDLYSFMIRHDASEELLRAFDNVIVHQADNRDFFEWEEDANGILMPLD